MLPAGTPYAGGFFRVKLHLSKNFPTEPPKGFFLTKIFHPNVAHNGEICVNTLKRDWKAEFGIKHILLVRILVLFAACRNTGDNDTNVLYYNDHNAKLAVFTEINKLMHSISERSKGQCHAAQYINLFSGGFLC